MDPEFLDRFSSHFGGHFGVQILSKRVPKIGPKIDNLGAHFWIPFLLGLGALRLPLGSPLGPPKALLGGLWTPNKNLKQLKGL